MASALFVRLRNATNTAMSRPEKKAVARDMKAQADARVTAKVTNMGLLAADSKTGQLVSTRKMQRAVIALCFPNDEVRKTAFMYAIGGALSLDALYEKNPELQSLADETMLSADSALPAMFVVELFNVLRLPPGQIDYAFKRIRFESSTRLNPASNKGVPMEAFIDFDSDLQSNFQLEHKLCKLLSADRLVLFFAATCLLTKNAAAVIALTRSGRYTNDVGRATMLKVLQRHNGCMWNNRATDSIDTLDRRTSTAASWYQLLKHLGEADAAYTTAPSTEVLDGSVDPYAPEETDRPTAGRAAAAPPTPARGGEDDEAGDDDSFVSGATDGSEAGDGLSGFESGDDDSAAEDDDVPKVETTTTATVKTTSTPSGDTTVVDRTTEQTVEEAAEEVQRAESRIASGVCANSCAYHDRHSGSPLALCPDACVSNRIGAALKQGRTSHKHRDQWEHSRAQRRTIESMTRTMPKSQEVVMRDRGIKRETSRPYTDSRDMADAMHSMIGLEYHAQSANEHSRQDLLLIDRLAVAVGRGSAPIGQRAAIYATTYGLADPRSALLLQPMNLTKAQAQAAADFKAQFQAPGLKEMQVIASLMGPSQ